jgi:hypothetical protein
MTLRGLVSIGIGMGLWRNFGAAPFILRRCDATPTCTVTATVPLRHEHEVRRWPVLVRSRAARKIIEIANSVEVVQDGRIYIELINGSFLFSEWTWRSSAAGWRCMRVEPMGSSPTQVLICLPRAELRNLTNGLLPGSMAALVHPPALTEGVI